MSLYLLLSGTDMIHDSSPWKTELARDAVVIERWAAKPRVSERRSFLIERTAYTLRKLDEAAKLSTATLSDVVPVTRFPPVKPGFSEINSHRFDVYFNLKKPQSAAMPGRRLANVLIHSLVFVEVIGDDGACEGFMVTSDFERERGLVQVALPVFIGLMRRAAEDYPSAMRRWLDPKTRKWRTWAGQDKPPDAS